MSARISSPVFVGRDEELGRLEAVLEGATAGTVGTVLVGGEAGVGKSRLLAEFRTRAASAGVRVLEGGCVDLGDGARPYDPFVAALRPWLRSLPPEDFDRIVGPARSTVLQLIPDLESGSEGEAPIESPTSATQSLLYLQVLGLIERIAADAPTIVALEDLHWSDRSTRDLLRFLARNLTHGRTMLIGTYRTDELNERHPFLTLLAELGRSAPVERFELARFTPGEVRDQIAGILGHAPDRPLVARLHERGGGNPFFTEELLAVAERGEQRMGLTLREALLARVGGLSTTSRDVLRVVAVAGQSAREDVLALVTRMEPSDIASALREAVDRYLLQAGDDGVMQFRHGLLQEAVNDELLPGERLALHAAVAEAVESLHADLDMDATVASELAHHWYEARDARQSLPALLRAGQAAERVFAYGNAFAHFHLALSLWPTLTEAVDGMTRQELRMRTAEAAALTASYRRAIDLVLGRWTTTWPSSRTRCAPARCSSGWPRITSGRVTPMRRSPSRAVRSRSYPRTPRRSRARRCRASSRTRLGCRATSTSPIAWPKKPSRPRAGLAAVEAEIRALGSIGRNATAVGDATAGVRTLREALALARTAGDFTGAAEIAIELALALHWAGDLQDACAVADEAIAECGRWGAEGLGAPCERSGACRRTSSDAGRKRTSGSQAPSSGTRSDHPVSWRTVPEGLSTWVVAGWTRPPNTSRSSC